MKWCGFVEKHSKKENIEKTEIMLELQENLDSFNYSSYEFNPQIRISVKDEIQFTKYGHIA